MRLTNKQARFCNEYMTDFNATQAAIRAGYSQKTAAQAGCSLLTKPNIKEKITLTTNEMAGDNLATVNRIISELCGIAFTRVTDVVSISPGGVASVNPIDELTDSQQRAIESISQTQFGVKIKMHDKVRAIELLGRHLGMWVEKIEIDTKSPFDDFTDEELDQIING